VNSFCEQTGEMKVFCLVVLLAAAGSAQKKNNKKQGGPKLLSPPVPEKCSSSEKTKYSVDLVILCTMCVVICSTIHNTSICNNKD